MRRATITRYPEVAEHLAACKPFRHSSMSAHYDGDVYLVLSYDEVIARVDTDAVPMTTQLNPRKYSQTTSRHLKLCRDNLPGHRTGWEENR